MPHLIFAYVDHTSSQTMAARTPAMIPATANPSTLPVGAAAFPDEVEDADDVVAGFEVVAGVVVVAGLEVVGTDTEGTPVDGAEVAVTDGVPVPSGIVTEPVASVSVSAGSVAVAVSTTDGKVSMLVGLRNDGVSVVVF
jgi:hypothetical protein